MEERRKAKADEQRYRELYKVTQLKKRCNEAKEHWIHTQCEEIEASTGVNSKTVHQKIREKSGSKNRVHTIKRWRHSDRKEDILNRWSEYITELYHDNTDPSPIINNDGSPQILEEEVVKKDKAAGPDDIPS